MEAQVYGSEVIPDLVSAEAVEPGGWINKKNSLYGVHGILL
jgi:hypothetical protein